MEISNSNTQMVVRTWNNIRNQQFEENPNMWYNLSTNRFNKSQPKKSHINYSLRKIRILGTLDQVIQFWSLNVNLLGTIYNTGTTFEEALFQPFSDIRFLTEDATRRSQECYLGGAGTVISATKATDVEHLTETEIGQLCQFNFGGLFVKCRVINVIDGDTINAVIFIPIHSLGSARAVGPKGSPRVGLLPQQSILNNKETGFFSLITIRMYGYDAQEKDTDEGKLAKRLLTEKLMSLGNIVWCQFIEINIAQEKYDRMLGVLFEDKSRKLALNDYLLKKEKELNVRLVNPYLGGTKQTFN